MKKLLFVGAVLVASLICCTSCEEKEKCWKVTRDTNGQKDAAYFYGLKSMVDAQMQQMQKITPFTYTMESVDKAQADCNGIEKL